MDSPFSKKAQVERGTPPERREKIKSKADATKGQDQEDAIVESFQRDGVKARRNHQGRTGGGMGNPDVKAMRGWHFESKNENQVRFPAYVEQLKEDCPATCRGGIIFNHDGVRWMAIRLEDKANFAQDFIEAAGGDITFH